MKKLKLEHIIITVITLIIAMLVFDFYRHDAPPDGYHIERSASGIYAFVDPDGYRATVMTAITKQGAINAAWLFKEYQDKRAADTNWTTVTH